MLFRRVAHALGQHKVQPPGPGNLQAHPVGYLDQALVPRRLHNGVVEQVVVVIVLHRVLVALHLGIDVPDLVLLLPGQSPVVHDDVDGGHLDGLAHLAYLDHVLQRHGGHLGPRGGGLQQAVGREQQHCLPDGGAAHVQLLLQGVVRHGHPGRQLEIDDFVLDIVIGLLHLRPLFSRHGVSSPSALPGAWSPYLYLI